MDDTSVIVLRYGADTGAVDRIVWTNRGMSGQSVAARTLAVNYRVEVEAGGQVRAYAFRLGPLPAIDDSVIFAPPAAGDAPTVVSRGRLPLWNATPGLYDLLLRRAHALVGSTDANGASRTTAVPLFRFGAASARDSAGVTFLGRDSARIELRTDGAPSVEMFARVDSAGRLIRAEVPAQGWTIERARALPAQSYALAPAYGAPANAPYMAEEVRFDVGGGVTLVGTLTRPVNATRPVPAVVLLHGSTPSDRNNARLPLPGLFWQLADTLGRRGIAVLRYDQRGVGGSGGVADSATVQVRAADARAALAYLGQRSEIDASRLGVLGLSEGALVAAILAASPEAATVATELPAQNHSASHVDDPPPPVRAVVLLSSPGRPGSALSEHQNRVHAERFRGLRGAALAAALASARAEDDSVMRVGRGHDAALLRYDPLPAARRVRAPVLIVHGESDLLIPVEDAERLAIALRQGGNRDVTLRTFPEVNHVLTADANGDWRRYVAVPSLVAPAAVRGLIANWLAVRLATASVGEAGR